MAEEKKDSRTTVFASVEYTKVPKYSPSQIGSRKYVPFGEDNLFPQRLIEMSTESAMHGRLVELLGNAIAGRGWVGTPEASAFLQMLDEDNDGETLLERVAQDLAMFNGFALQVIWSRAKKVAKVYHMEFQNIRAGKPQADGTVAEYLYSLEWKNSYSYRPVCYPAFDPENVVPNEDGDTSQVLYVKMYSPGSPIYPLPKYAKGLKHIEIDAALTIYSLSSVTNCFTPGVILQMPHEDNKDNRNMIGHDLEEHFSGPENAGKPLVWWMNRENEEIKKIELGEAVSADAFRFSHERAEKGILDAHGVNPTMGGLAGGGGLSANADEIMAAYTLHQNTDVRKYQQKVVAAFARLLRINGLSTDNLGVMPFDPNSGMEKVDNSDTVAVKAQPMQNTAGQ